jgi:inhibitor of cysteine peptidase
MSEVIFVSEKDNRRNIEVPVGEALDISLEENPTTGFKWEIHAQPQDILKLAADDFELGMASGVGGGGVRRFRFEAIKHGQGTIYLRYCRSWEKAEKFTKEFTLNILTK